MRKIIFSIFIAFLFACTEEKPLSKEIVNKETKVFSYFLEEAFSWQIKEKPHAYILVNGAVCKGCVSRVMVKLPELLPKGSNQHTIITNNPRVFSKEIKERNYFYKDTTDLISSINLDIENITVIHTKNREVTRIDRIGLDNMNDDLTSFFGVEEDE